MVLLSRPLRSRRPRWSGMVCGNRRHTIVPFETRVSYCPIRIKKKVCRYFRTHFVPARASASGLLRLMGFLVCNRQQLYGNTCVWYLRLIDRRRSVTVTDHNRSYGNQALENNQNLLFYPHIHNATLLVVFVQAEAGQCKPEDHTFYYNYCLCEKNFPVR